MSPLDARRPLPQRRPHALLFPSPQTLPGCYFNPALLLPALEDPATAAFLCADRIRSCLHLGGVRIEDNVLVTATGAESFTNVPRTVADIERVCAGGAWP